MNRKISWKGILDYKIIAVVLVYFFVIYNILNFLNIPIFYTVYFLALSVIPVVGIYITVLREENAIDLIINIARYAIKPKVYIYEYENEIDRYCAIKKKRTCKKCKYIKKVFGCKND